MSSQTPPQVQIAVNRTSQMVPKGQSVLALLQSLEIPTERVAVEYNREILKKENWDSTRLGEGDQLEIVHFVGGG